MKSRTNSLGTMPRSFFNSSSLSTWLSRSRNEQETRRSFAAAFTTDGNGFSTGNGFARKVRSFVDGSGTTSGISLGGSTGDRRSRMGSMGV